MTKTINTSVVNIAKIAKRFGYKQEVVYVSPSRAFLSISDNFLRSPYPCHLTSNVASASYVQRVFNENE